MAVKIEKDTIIGDVLDLAPETAPLFQAIGMHCLGCPSSRGETVEEACMVHGVDVDKRKIELDGDIKAFGTYRCEVKLYTGISAKVYVVVTEA